MSERKKIYEAIRTYEGRVTDQKFADSLDTAKTLARNYAHLDEPGEWVDSENRERYHVLTGTGDDTSVEVKKHWMVVSDE